LLLDFGVVEVFLAEHAASWRRGVGAWMLPQNGCMPAQPAPI
jgi:hypothetical protein